MSVNLEELNKEQLITLVRAVSVGFPGCDLCVHTDKSMSEPPCCGCSIAQVPEDEDYFKLDIKPILKWGAKNGQTT